MKFYSIDTILTFGKYDGKSINEVLVIQPSYLDWCIINLEHFYFEDEVIGEMESTNRFTLTSQAKDVLVEKYQNWVAKNNSLQDTDNWDDDCYDYGSDSDRNNFDALTDGQCGDYEDWDGDWDNLRDSMGY